MFLKLKKNFAKTALAVLALQIIFIGLSGGAGKAFATEVPSMNGPELQSVTAVFGGESQTVNADTNLRALVGQSVGSITAKVSEKSTFVDPLATEGTITISSSDGIIPAGTQYGAFAINSNDPTELNIKPSGNNAALALAGTFTFSVAAGQIQSISGTPNCDTTFTLVVGNHKVDSIGSIAGKSEVGSTLTAGPLSPIGATVSYQWQSATKIDGSYTDIIGAKDVTYTPTTSDLGQFIRVAVTGINDYIGTVYSLPTMTSVSAVAPVVPVITPTVKLASVVAADTEIDTYVEPIVSSDTGKDEGTVTSTTDSKNAKTSDTKKENNLPIWAIVLLIIIAAIGGYLIYNQKPSIPQIATSTKKKIEPETAPILSEKEVLTKKTATKKSNSKMISKKSPKPNTRKNK